MPRPPRKNQRWKAAGKCDGRCWYCGDEPEELTADHAKPRSRGGCNFDDNLLPACLPCNNEKSNLTVSEYRKYCKMKLIRRLMPLGFFSGDLSKIRIVFFGEGNDSPFTY